MTSTAANVNDDSLVLSEVKTGVYIYNRSTHPPAEQLSLKLAELYGGANTQCLLATSGMNAISTTIQMVIHRLGGTDDHINLIQSSRVFSPTITTFKYWEEIHNCKRYLFDPADTQERLIGLLDQDSMRDQINIVFVESCSNPEGIVFDMSVLAEWRKLSKQCVVIVDNTWLSSTIFNPLDHGADLVVTSLTKYYSGGSCIAGAILTRNAQFYNALLKLHRVTGIHVSPIHCEHVLEALKTLDERVLRASDTTVELLQLLTQKCPQLIDGTVVVTHPALHSHPSYALSKTYFKCNSVTKEVMYPSVLSFIIPMKLKQAQVWLESKSQEIAYKTSFGARESRLDTFPKRVSNQTTQCRLSVGADDSPERLFILLYSAFAALPQTILK